MNERQPIENLAQLKRALQPGTQFRVLRHAHESMVGLVKQVNIKQSDSVYVQLAGQPDHPSSTCNGGRGSWMPFSKAPFYTFNDGVVTLYSTPGDENTVIYAFEVLAEQEVSA